MNDTMLGYWERVRRRVVKLSEELTDEQAMRVPEGFNNSVLWHLGHIYLYGERFSFQLTGHQELLELPGEYPEMFGNGTKPADWTAMPPSLNVLRRQLEGQLARTRAALSGRLADVLERKVMNIENPTIEEVLLLGMLHEKEHTGYMAAIRRLVVS